MSCLWIFNYMFWMLSAFLQDRTACFVGNAYRRLIQTELFVSLGVVW